ncbi:MAG TPA: enoyl-CoA hydratase/isomerase family protein [Firmicutes bacterium]|nr:enoyl-CoA hydratase/isomerase family protein [Bacillota bacterium]
MIVKIRGETKLNDKDDITLEIGHPYAILKIDRKGDKYNTIVPSMVYAMDECLTTVEHDPEIRVLIITGNDRTFSTGVDVSDPSVKNMDPLQARFFSKVGKSMFDRIESLDVPTIAAVNGTALGGGLELALSCDFRIASERAIFGLPESQLGIIPGWGGTQRLLRHLGYSKSLDMILSGEMIKAKDARELGLVQELVPKNDDVLEAAKKWAEKFVKRSRVALALCKKAVRIAWDLPLHYGEEYEAELFALAWASRHRKIGIDSFNEREKPEFPTSWE